MIMLNGDVNLPTIQPTNQPILCENLSIYRYFSKSVWNCHNGGSLVLRLTRWRTSSHLNCTPRLISSSSIFRWIYGKYLIGKFLKVFRFLPCCLYSRLIRTCNLRQLSQACCTTSFSPTFYTQSVSVFHLIAIFNMCWTFYVSEYYWKLRMMAVCNPTHSNSDFAYDFLAVCCFN